MLLEVGITAGIPVPCELYENYISVSLAALAMQSGLSVEAMRSKFQEMNSNGSGYLSIFNRLNDGVEWGSGYIFQ